MTSALYYGDNLDVLRGFPADFVDLIYLDPPFNSSASYNVLFKAPSGESSRAQIEAFEDTWHWNESAELAFDDVSHRHSNAATVLRAVRSALGTNDLMAYLAMMAVRLIELHRVLKPTGSLYLHCDPTASHYLKIILDAVFGPTNYRNEIVWRRYKRPKGSQHIARHYGRSTDSIFFYSKSDQYQFHLDRIRTPIDEEATIAKMYPHEDEHGRYMSGPLLRSEGMGLRPNLVFEFKGYTPGPAGWRMTRDKLEQLDEAGDVYFTSNGVPRRKVRPGDEPSAAVDNLWTDVEALSAHAKERLGYPTQKPLALLERIITASSNEGDTVLDPFCGCGTTVHAAQKLGRQWIGIDITHLAISLIERRLKDAFPGIAFEVHGTPKDLDGARNLMSRDPYQFQWWATSLVGALPAGGKKKGMDRGIDGYLHFRDAENEPQIAIVSVKGGAHVGPDMIRVLKTVVDREKAVMGLFVSLAEPTREMETERASAGYYETGGRRFKKIQILTIEDLFSGKKPDVPFGFTEGFKKAGREQSGEQGELL